MKFLLTFLLFIFLNNCSLNKDSTYWTEDSINPGQKQFIKFDKLKSSIKSNII